MFIVMVDLWNNTHDDYYGFEYSGIEHVIREVAEVELAQAQVEMTFRDDVKDVYIKEV